MLYRARYLVPMSGPPMVDGALRVEGNLITAMGFSRDVTPLIGEEIWQGDQHILLPGLINSHVHLELHGLRGCLQPGLAFPDWVRGLRTLTSAWTDADYLSGCRLGALESLRHGTTTLVDIGNTGATCAAVADLPLRVYAGLEILGLDPAVAKERLAQGLLRLQTTPTGPLLQKGLVPHSGYSLSLTLLHALKSLALENNSDGLVFPFSIHAGESREEEFLFAAGGGALHDFCRSIYAGAPDHHGETPLGYLREKELLPKGALVVHANGRAAQEIDYLNDLKATVVHCPQSHTFFGHPAFPAAAYSEAGIPLALGTDSFASGSSLSLWKAMRDFWQRHSDWTPEAILAMTTLNPGRALGGASGNLGHLSVGALADLVGVRLEVLPGSNPIAELIHETQDIALVVVNGEPVLI